MWQSRKKRRRHHQSIHFFFEISPVTDCEWTVTLVHDDQKDRYDYEKNGTQFDINMQGKKIAVAFDESTAKDIVRLLNGASY